jgi:hypothetical protein
VDPGILENGGDLRSLVGVVIVVAEDGDHGHADIRKLGDERFRLGRFARSGEIASQEEKVGLILQVGQERLQRPGGLWPGVEVSGGSNTDHPVIVPRFKRSRARVPRMTCPAAVLALRL